MLTFAQRFHQAKPFLADVYFLVLIPFFWVISLPGQILFYLVRPLGKAYLYGCLELLNVLVRPWSAHLTEIKKHSKSLEIFWETFDAPGLLLYELALKDKNWFKGKLILDVGCGVGRKSYELAKNGAAKVLGADTAFRNIEAAKKQAGSQEHLLFRHLDTKDLTAEYDNTFDYIISFTVFEHVDDPVSLLKDLYRLQKPGGRNVIVFNHYNDRYGSHLKEYIHHPWPQLIFPESLLFSYWNEHLEQDQKNNEMMYFPKGYRHGFDGHNNDCYMNLNKITVNQFRRMVASTGYTTEHEFFYSRSPVLGQYPVLEKTFFGKYLIGSVAYVLRKPV